MNEILEHQIRLITRAVALRKTRRIPPVWIDPEGGDVLRVSVAPSEFDVAVRRRISWSEFEAMIVAAENASPVARKPAGSEGGTDGKEAIA